MRFFKIIPLVVLFMIFSQVKLSKTFATAQTSEHRFPENAVVFTGGIQRIEEALRLLAQNKIKRLLISGDSPENILNIPSISQLISEFPDLQRAREENRLVFGTVATNTLQNGAEALCWLNSIQSPMQVLLITSKSHMPRASYVLRQMDEDLDVIEFSVDDVARSPKELDVIRSVEQAEFLATWMLQQLPRNWFPENGVLNCAEENFR